MALILADRVRETSTTTGTGALSLAGAVVGYQTFSSAIGNTNTCYYAISNPGVAEWEVGIGTYATSGNTLTRTTIIKSSNANAAVNFSAGTKDVFVTYPATKSVYLDASGNASALGTPASGTVTNLTGTASININGTVGATTPAAGAFTTLTSTGNGLISNGVGAITNPAGWTNLFQIRSNNSPAFSLVDTNAGGTSIQQWDIASNAVTFNLYNSTLGSNALTINATTNLISMTSGLAVTGTLSATLDATIYGVTVGRGAGAVSTNTAVGASALAANTSGEDNTAIGYQAGYTNVSGVGGTFLGMSAGYFVTGSYNTAIGRFSGGTQAISAGTNNTSIGNTAGYRLTAGLCNTAIGDSALFNNTTASGSTAVGYQALYTSNRTADVSAYNSAFGYQAGFLLGTGQFNTFIGLQAGYFCSSGVANTFIGVNASGGGAGSSVTGSKNVIIGGYTGSAAPISATGSNYIVLSDGDGNPRAYWNGAAATFNGGLAVTGTLSASGAITLTGSGGSLSTVLFNTTDVGIWRGQSNSLTGGNYLNLGGYAGVTITSGTAAVGSQTKVAEFTQTGLAVTGTLSATGTATPLSITPTGNAVSLSVLQGNDANAVRVSAGGNVSAYLETRGYLGVKMLADTSTIGTFSSTGLAVTGTLSVASNSGSVFTGSNGTSGNTQALRITSTNTSAGTVVIDAYTYGTNSYGALAFNVGNAGTYAMTLDASGNFGLGVTPSAWASGWKALQFSSTGGNPIFLASSGDVALGLLNNAYYNGSNYIYQTGAPATQYYNSGGAHYWLSAASGTAGNAITFTQAMTLDASGNLGVGITSPSQKLTVNAIATISDPASSTSQLTFGDAASDFAGRIFYSHSDDAMHFFVNAAEAARIDSSGYFCINSTTPAANAKNSQLIVKSNDISATAYGITIVNNANSTSGRFINFVNYNDASAGSISQPTATTVLFNTTSDYRLKTVIRAVTGAGERIDALKPIDYHWIDGGEQARGFLAHEFQEVYANSVTGEKDAVDDNGKPIHQAMQASTPEVIADLVAELQSLRKRITALENK